MVRQNVGGGDFLSLSLSPRLFCIPKTSTLIPNIKAGFGFCFGKNKNSIHDSKVQQSFPVIKQTHYAYLCSRSLLW